VQAVARSSRATPTKGQSERLSFLFFYSKKIWQDKNLTFCFFERNKAPKNIHIKILLNNIILFTSYSNI